MLVVAGRTRGRDRSPIIGNVLTSMSIALLALLPLTACSAEQRFQWSEEVRLSDGQTLLVQRAETYRQVTDPGAGFRRGWLFARSCISADLPDPVGHKVEWEGNLIPLVLDITPSGAVFLVGWAPTGSGMIEWNLSRREHYVVFRLSEAGWQRVTLEDLPLSMQPNLVGNTETLFIIKKRPSGIHVDLKTKARLQSDPDTPSELKSIIRPRSNSKEK